MEKKTFLYSFDSGSFYLLAIGFWLDSGFVLWLKSYPQVELVGVYLLTLFCVIVKLWKTKGQTIKLLNTKTKK